MTRGNYPHLPPSSNWTRKDQARCMVSFTENPIEWMIWGWPNMTSETTKYVWKKIPRWGPQSIAFNCRISVAKNGRYNELVNGGYFMVYKPTYIWGTLSCAMLPRQRRAPTTWRFIDDVCTWLPFPGGHTFGWLYIPFGFEWIKILILCIFMSTIFVRKSWWRVLHMIALVGCNWIPCHWGICRCPAQQQGRLQRILDVQCFSWLPKWITPRCPFAYIQYFRGC